MTRRCTLGAALATATSAVLSAHAALAPAHPPLALTGPGALAIPLRAARAVYVPGVGARVAGEWVPYEESHAPATSVLAFDCFEPDPGTGVPTDGRYGADCGMGSSRWYFGPSYSDPFIVNDMTVATGFAGASADRMEAAWYMSCQIGPPSERFLLAVFTAESFDSTCVGPDASDYYEGVVLDFGVLNCSGDYYYADVDLASIGALLQLPVDGSGAYAIVFAQDVDQQGVLTVSTAAQAMLWGTKPLNPSQQGEIQWDDDSPTDGDHSAPYECYSYDFGLCPNPLGSMICFYAPAVDDCNGNGIPDALDIAIGISKDLNGNGRPDECEWNASFEQLDWANGDGTYVSASSDWGRIGFTFDPANLSLLYAHPAGGSYGWLNVVTVVPGTPGPNWAVQNLPVYFADAAAMSGRLPTGVWFNLGVASGTPVLSLDYTVAVSPDPLQSMPTGGMVIGAPVGKRDVLFGGVISSEPPSSAGSSSGRPPPPAGNFVGALPGTTHTKEPAKITIKEDKVVAVDEDINGCVPGAIARSLAYLDSEFPSMNLTDGAQAIYNALKGLMGTSIGETGAGTDKKNATDGKKQYVKNHVKEVGGTIATTTSNSLNIATLATSLEKGADVEIYINWGKKADDPNATSHCAFVSSVTILLDQHDHATGFTVTTIDDKQGDHKAANQSTTYTFDRNGNMISPQGLPGARCEGFLVETYSKLDHIPHR